MVASLAYSITIVLLILMFFNVSILDVVFGDSDYILELQNLNNEPVVSNLEIDGEAYLQICPYSNCQIEVINSSFIHPSTNSLMINHSIDFNVVYNLKGTNTSISKINLEKFRESMNGCIVYNIVEDSKHKLYFCDDGIDIIKRNSDSESWYYESIGIYDEFKNTYIVKGDFKSSNS